MRAMLILVGVVVLVQLAVTQQFGSPGIPAPAPTPDSSGGKRCYGDNEIFGCVNSRVGCSDSCADRTKKPLSTECKKETTCPAMQCICKEGFVRDANHSCVSVAEGCPNRDCGDNEYYCTCKSSCFRDTCDKKDLALRDENCDSPCNGEGCFCEPGYARNPTGKCVLKNTCPTNCPTNEVFSACKNCAADTCEDGLNAPQKKCRTNCVGGCVCKADSLRNPNGLWRCGPPDQCPSTNVPSGGSDEGSPADGSAGGAPPAGAAAAGGGELITPRRKRP